MEILWWHYYEHSMCSYVWIEQTPADQLTSLWLVFSAGAHSQARLSPSIFVVDCFVPEFFAPPPCLFHFSHSFPLFLFPSAGLSVTSVIGRLGASAMESVSIATIQAPFPQNAGALPTPLRPLSQTHRRSSLVAIRTLIAPKGGDYLRGGGLIK